MAPSSNAPPIKASVALPGIYRFLLMNVESLMAVGGVLLVLFKPQDYVSNLTRETVNINAGDGTQFVYTELAGAWMVIVFIEGVIMRVVDDLRVWRLLCIAILLSDVLYTHSLAQAVGGWAEWADLSKWTVQDWVTTITTWPFVITRLLIVLGVGQRKVKGA